ncbi:MBD3 protein, partial [Aphelenchoides avenae]
MGRTKCSEAGTLARKNQQKIKGKNAASVACRNGFDGPLDAPWRKTPSIFKQPVTLVHTTSKETQKTPPDLEKRIVPQGKSKERLTDRPRQIFWSKSLEGLRAMVPVRLADRYDVEKDIHVEQRLALPNHVEPVIPAVLSEEASAATLCSQLQMNSTAPIVGQTATKKQIEGNPRAHSNGSQPFVQMPVVTEQEIAHQERR